MGFLKRIRRERILETGLIGDGEWKALLEDHPIFDGLPAEDGTSLRELSTLFLHEKVFESPGDLELTPYRKAVIAAQASLPLLGLGPDWYRNWKTVVVVPDVFVDGNTEHDRAGVVHEWEEDRSGEAWEQGPVVVSWEDVEASGWGDGYNVIIHEAAHVLDMQDGGLNGIPDLHEDMDQGEWKSAFAAAFQDLKLRAGRAKKRGKRRLPIDEYATESDCEFFAVSCEYFFERPRVLRGEYPDVYRLMARFFRRDPAERLGSSTRPR